MSDAKRNQVTISLIHLEQFYLIYLTTKIAHLQPIMWYVSTRLDLLKFQRHKILKQANYNPYLVTFHLIYCLLPQPGKCLHGGIPYITTDKFERPDLGPFLKVLANNKLLKHYNPFRNCTKGQYRRKIF